MYKHFFKRFLAFILSWIGLIVLSPIFIIISAVLLFFNNGKPFFFQQRPGRNAKIFQVIKFKTMDDKKNIDGKLLPDSERLTVIGRFIRKTSLDEIPQLINVITGNMSFVGPRPLLVDYLPLYNEEQKRRHEIRPGITGWAQVNGRNAITWEEKFRLDVWYVDHVSFWLDLKILFLTAIKVCKGEGISSTTSVSMEKFEGSQNQYCVDNRKE